MSINQSNMAEASSAILFIIGLRRAGIENWVKYAILRVRMSLCLCLCASGGWFWKKISCKRLSEEKNCMQHKCNRELMGKKGKKNILPTILLEKKILDDQKSLTPTLES